MEKKKTKKTNNQTIKPDVLLFQSLSFCLQSVARALFKLSPLKINLISTL